jgi:hypothetical protein
MRPDIRAHFFALIPRLSQREKAPAIADGRFNQGM